MEMNELKLLWQAYDNKLERSLKLNLRCLEMIQAQKVRSKLKPLLWQRIIEIILHIIVIYWLGGFLFKHFFEVQFAVPATVLMLFFIIAFSNGIKQIIVIREIDYTEDIITIQKKLTLLQSHALDYIRLTFLCIPTYLAYPIIAFKVIGVDIVSGLGNNSWWIGQFVFTAVTIPICIWFYTQVSYKNIHRKWVKFIIEKSAGSTVRKAMEFTKELDEIKQEAVTIDNG